ncbi:MAG: hypothetical protein FWE01_02155 [Firmicutes bacterium]|nr:hypothetical protein [Bacillota bacterium]
MRFGKSKFKFTKKKFLILGCVAVLIVAFVLIATLSTGGKASLYQRALANVSEARFFMKHAESDVVRVQFFSGIRERDYNVDGTATGTVPFALINIEPKDGNLHGVDQLRGFLTICDEEEQEVTLERNQFGGNFGVDIGREVACNANITFSLVLQNNSRANFDLKPAMPEDAISWTKALEIATEHLADHIRNVTSFETYVKIVTDLANIGAFWFIQFVTDTQDRHFAIINPDGSIIGN